MDGLGPEDDSQYEAYQLQLEHQQWLEEMEIEMINFEILDWAQKQRDLKGVDFN